MSRANCVTDRKSLTAQVTCTITRDQYNRVDAIAESRGITKSELLRGLLADLIEKDIARAQS